MQSDNQPEISSQSAESFHLIVENIKDYAIFMTDADGRVVSWNPGVERLLGYAESEIVNQSIAVIFTAEDAAAGAHLREMEAAASAGNSEDKRWHKRKDGSLFWANGLVMPLKNDDGTLRGFAKVMRDDTAQKQAEEKLEQSNRRVENVLSSISDAFYTFDREFRYVYVNEATTKMFDLPESEFLGKTLSDLFPDVEGNQFHAQVRRALGEQTTVVFENYYPPLDRWFENRVYPSAHGLSVFTAEITERKQAEERLRESEKRYRTLFDSIEEGFCVVELIFDANGKAIDYRFLETNPAFEKQSGLDGAVGKRIRKLAPNHEEFWFETYGRVALTGEAVRFERRAADFDGWLDIYAFRAGEPESRRVAVLFNDITERKQAEIMLRESEQQLLNLAEFIPQMVWMAAADGFIFWYNRNWYEYTGTTAADMEGWGWQSVHDPAMLPQVMTRWTASIESGEAFEMEFPLRRADGKFRWFLTRVNPMRDAEGRITRWFGTNTDIDEQKDIKAKLEEANALLEDSLRREQQARQTAEQANRLKDEFLATVSHELRTPLNAILGWAQMLQQPKHFDENSMKSALTTIERNARAQNQLIDDLLDVSRIITGKMRLDVRAVDLGTVIVAAVEAARPAAEAKNIRLQTLLDPSAGQISGDPDRLQQVVWNLLSNAVKFTPKKGRVQVRLERINSHVEIVVSDTGAGIEAEFLPQVFDRFRQADQTTTRRHGGLGLGLAIVRQLVELHGGDVAAASAGEGHGTTFTVSLPLLPLRNEPEHSEPRARPNAERGKSLDCPPELAGLRLLVVDDQTDARDLLEAVLNDCGANVTVAASAAQALERIERDESFDVLITDIGMPEEDGYSLIQKVRRLPDERGGKMPAVALTAYARAEDRVRALRAGFQMHIPKPVEAAELITVIASLTGGMNGGKMP